MNWSDIPLIFGYAENSRGLGVADIAQSILDGTTPRANLDLTYHVLDVMQSIHESSNEKRTLDLQSNCIKPSLLDNV